jgi:hypothetical protein
MAKTNLTKTEIKDIVNDEMSKFVTRELENEMTKLLKTGKPRDEMVDLIKVALTALYKYMWIRKDVWQNDIR